MNNYKLLSKTKPVADDRYIVDEEFVDPSKTDLVLVLKWLSIRFPILTSWKVLNYIPENITKTQARLLAIGINPFIEDKIRNIFVKRPTEDSLKQITNPVIRMKLGLPELKITYTYRKINFLEECLFKFPKAIELMDLIDEKFPATAINLIEYLKWLKETKKKFYDAQIYIKDSEIEQLIGKNEELIKDETESNLKNLTEKLKCYIDARGIVFDIEINTPIVAEAITACNFRDMSIASKTIRKYIKNIFPAGKPGTKEKDVNVIKEITYILWSLDFHAFNC